ncbi:phosphodiester glycosidase family protein [Synechococcus sp. RSCCF101]|nr:phosphodiester glycosidase family protein [Synechococcus sp. RSCCF101]
MTRPAAAPDGERASAGPASRGTRVVINGRERQAPWLWQGGDATRPEALWLPLELLEGQLGFRRAPAADPSTLRLQWYSEAFDLPAAAQRTLEDEVAVDVTARLLEAGLALSHANGRLNITLPPAAVEQLRAGPPGPRRRLVFDLAAAALVEEQGGDLVLGLVSTPALLSQLRALGLKPVQEAGGLRLRGAVRADTAVFTLAGPWRIVLDGAGGTASASGVVPLAQALLNPTLQTLLSQGVAIDRLVRGVGVRRFAVTRVGMAPSRGAPLQLKPLLRSDGMRGLSTLSALAGRSDAPIAINGGFFNRIRQLPLGALRLDGRWHSGPILNRGAAGWNAGELPQFDRLRLIETLTGPDGRSQPVLTVNSGYVQRGLSRYTADWGRVYQALSGQERAVLLRGGTVQAVLDQAALSRGVPLGAGVDLVVSRAGAPLPWPVGTPLRLNSRASHPLGQRSFVIGGGPLLLKDGRVVLNGRAEGFSPSFVKQAAPRTVLATDGRRLWLMTLEGVSGPGPTLLETSLLLQRLGMRQALNLDGGSSTALLLDGQLTVMGRGVPARVHSGLGLVAP